MAKLQVGDRLLNTMHKGRPNYDNYPRVERPSPWYTYIPIDDDDWVVLSATALLCATQGVVLWRWAWVEPTRWAFFAFIYGFGWWTLFTILLGNTAVAVVRGILAYRRHYNAWLTYLGNALL